mmetsp:Transcript_4485/g.16952  ORF Transcript_4485/g.16952 Transcript_4485/m.16952 type:complete len:89 (+) Transcript_4485:2457-2723(+)
MGVQQDTLPKSKIPKSGLVTLHGDCVRVLFCENLTRVVVESSPFTSAAGEGSDLGTNQHANMENCQLFLDNQELNAILKKRSREMHAN